MTAGSASSTERNRAGKAPASPTASSRADRYPSAPLRTCRATRPSPDRVGQEVPVSHSRSDVVNSVLFSVEWLSCHAGDLVEDAFQPQMGAGSSRWAVTSTSIDCPPETGRGVARGKNACPYTDEGEYGDVSKEMSGASVPRNHRPRPVSVPERDMAKDVFSASFRAVAPS